MVRFNLRDNYGPCEFNKILVICSNSIRYFTFTQHGQGSTNKYSKTYRKFLMALKKFKVYHHTYEWYQYQRPPIKWYGFSKKIGLRKKITVYKFNNQSRKILEEHFQDLFLGLKKWPFDYPEDICFFREDQTLLLGTVTHEHTAEFYLTDEELHWIEIPKGFIQCDDSKGPDFRKVPLNKRQHPFLRYKSCKYNGLISQDSIKIVG